MGCDIHCVVQKFKPALFPGGGKGWETIDIDIFGRDYELFNFLSGVRGTSVGIAEQGFPIDFLTHSNIHNHICHDGFWMGEHSFGHCTVEDFINNKASRYAPTVKILQKAFSLMYYIPREYRLVFGYDS